MNAADVGVRDLAGRANLVVKPRDGAAVAAERLGQELQRHLLIELHVVGPVDLSHPAATQKTEDSVAPRDGRAELEPALDKVSCHRRHGVRRQKGAADSTRGRAVDEIRDLKRGNLMLTKPGMAATGESAGPGDERALVPRRHQPERVVVERPA